MEVFRRCLLSARCIIYLTSVSQQLIDEWDQSDLEQRQAAAGRGALERPPIKHLVFFTTFTSFGTFPFSVKLNDSKVLVLSTNVTIGKHVGTQGEGKAKERLLSSAYLGFWSQTACQQTLLSHFHLCSRSLCVSIVRQQRRQGQLFVLTDKTEN